METIKSILAEMRKATPIYRGSDVIGEYRNSYLIKLADRIEQAVTSCNQLKMREALENSNGLLEELALIGEWGESANGQIAENKATLAEPPRNCDRFNNIKEAKAAYCNEVEKIPYCGDVRRGRTAATT